MKPNNLNELKNYLKINPNLHGRTNIHIQKRRFICEGFDDQNVIILKTDTGNKIKFRTCDVEYKEDRFIRYLRDIKCEYFYISNIQACSEEWDEFLLDVTQYRKK